jgi:hypothetical protein
MRGFDQHHAHNIAWMLRGVEPYEQSTDRMTDQHERA